MKINLTTAYLDLYKIFIVNAIQKDQIMTERIKNDFDTVPNEQYLRTIIFKIYNDVKLCHITKLCFYLHVRRNH